MFACTPFHVGGKQHKQLLQAVKRSEWKRYFCFFPLKWLLGFRLAAHWVRGRILRQRRGAQYLHPNHLNSPFAQLQLCNQDSKEGLRKAKPPSAQGESFPCSCPQGPSSPYKVSSWTGNHTSVLILHLPIGCPGSLQDTPAHALIPRHSLTKATLAQLPPGSCPASLLSPCTQLPALIHHQIPVFSSSLLYYNS